MTDTLVTRVAITVLLVVSALTVQPAGAQRERAAQDDAATTQALPVSPLLAENHWAVEAARRMEALGLAGDYLPAQRSVPQAVVGQALRRAERRASETTPALTRLARAYTARFADEFPGLADIFDGEEASPARVLAGAAHIGYLDRSGVLSPGIGLGVIPTGTFAVPPETGGVARGLLSAAVVPHVAFEIEPQYAEGDLDLREVDAIVGAGPIALSLGRQPLGYGYGRDGSVVLSATTLDRIQIETVRPIRLPGPLRYLGNISAHNFLSRFSEARHPGDPYFFGQRIAFQPHPRLVIAAQRASIFGGDSVDIAITPRQVARMMVGLYGGTYQFENQVASGSFRWRLPTERVLPLVVYGEWGMDDEAGAWHDVPAHLNGVWAPAVPGLPHAAIGVEYARFAPSCCGNPEWYRHFSLRGNWAAGDRPLGHALGGHGTEWLAYGSADVLDARLRLDGRVFVRDRGRENLYAPDRVGSSRGFAVRAAWRVLPRLEVGTFVFRDAGDGWREQEIRATSALFF